MNRNRILKLGALLLVGIMMAISPYTKAYAAPDLYKAGFHVYNTSMMERMVINHALTNLDGVKSVSWRPQSDLLIVKYNQNRVTTGFIKQYLDLLGFRARLVFDKPLMMNSGSGTSSFGFGNR